PRPPGGLNPHSLLTGPSTSVEHGYEARTDSVKHASVSECRPSRVRELTRLRRVDTSSTLRAFPPTKLERGSEALSKTAQSVPSRATVKGALGEDSAGSNAGIGSAS